MARRYFISPDRINDPEPLIEGDDAHHLKRVVRIRPGDQIDVFDGAGSDYRARVVALDRAGIRIRLSEPIIDRRESPLPITIAQGFLKDKKMDIVVRQLTELGITRWIPFFAHRSIAAPPPARIDARHQRWLKISREAVKQCGRSRTMRIDKPMPFDRLLQCAPDSVLKFLFYEDIDHAVPLNQLDGRAPSGLFVIIGPEGGFEAHEVKAAVSNGFDIASMGPRILRAETAAVAAAVMVQSLFGDMNQKILDNHQGV